MSLELDHANMGMRMENIGNGAAKGGYGAESPEYQNGDHKGISLKHH